MKRWTAYALVICLALTILPLLLISFYNVPFTDDFLHTIRTTHVWRETYSVWEVLKEAFSYVASQYMTMQGRYTETFLVSLFPTMFDYRLNFVNPWITILLFVGSSLFLSFVLFRKVIKGDKYDWALIEIPIIILQLLLICSPVEGIYWNAGAVAYTWGYAFALIAIGAFLQLTWQQDAHGKWGKVIWYSVLTLTTILFTGSNFIIGLFFMVIAFLICGITVWFHRDKVKTAVFWLLLGGISFGICLFAPGNSWRMNVVNAGYPPIKSILMSYGYATQFCLYFLQLPMILLFVLLIPVLWKLVRKFNFSFKHPVIAIFVAFSAFTSSLVPIYYGLGDLAPGPWRGQNIWKHLLFYLVLFSMIYIMGWLQKQVGVEIHVKFRINKWKKIGMLVSAFLCMGWCLYVMGPLKNLSSVSAVLSLKNGEAKRYYAEWMERVEILEDETVADAVLQPYINIPYVLFTYELEIKEDSGDDRNRFMQEFYDKESVRLAPKS